MSALIGVKNQIKNNLIYWLNDVLLDAGLYENISLAETDFLAQNQGKLFPVDDEEFPQVGTSSRVWQSPFTNWVYESGITPPSGMTAPTVASGVYVGGVFKTRGDISFSHAIDYERGRIIFSSAQSNSLDIKTEFAYKVVRVKFPTRSDEIFMGRNFYLNPEIDPVLNLPSGSVEQLPFVAIDYTEDSSEGLQLGGGRIVNSRILFHVLTSDEYMKDHIMDVIQREDRSVPRMVDWNKTNHPLDFNGDFATGEEPFSFKAKQADNSLFFRNLFFETMKGKDIPTEFDIERGIVDLETKVYQEIFK